MIEIDFLDDGRVYILREFLFLSSFVPYTVAILLLRNSTISLDMLMVITLTLHTLGVSVILDGTWLHQVIEEHIIIVAGFYHT